MLVVHASRVLSNLIDNYNNENQLLAKFFSYLKVISSKQLLINEKRIVPWSITIDGAPTQNKT